MQNSSFPVIIVISLFACHVVHSEVMVYVGDFEGGHTHSIFFFFSKSNNLSLEWFHPSHRLILILYM